MTRTDAPGARQAFAPVTLFSLLIAFAANATSDQPAKLLFALVVAEMVRLALATISMHV
jgi:hypothetical protein